MANKHTKGCLRPSQQETKSKPQDAPSRVLGRLQSTELEVTSAGEDVGTQSLAHSQGAREWCRKTVWRVPQKVRHRIATQSQGALLTELETGTQADTCSLVLTAAPPPEPRGTRHSGHRCCRGDRENGVLTPRDAQQRKETEPGNTVPHGTGQSRTDRHRVAPLA